MTIKPLTILQYPNPLLLMVARPVDDFAAAKDLAHRMVAAMRTANGIGLAAPQIGELLRIIVVENDNGSAYILINPEIIESDEKNKTQRDEGCLSIPGVTGAVTRPSKVVVQGVDENGKMQRIVGEGLLAACFQHEIDHLNGVLFIDYLSILKRERLIKKYKKLVREENLSAGSG